MKELEMKACYSGILRSWQLQGPKGGAAI